MSSVGICHLQVKEERKTFVIGRRANHVKQLQKQDSKTSQQLTTVKYTTLPNTETEASFLKMKSLSDQKCQPKTNIVFVKTFKTGGSTLTNILSRFAMKHNLCIRGCEITSTRLIRKFWQHYINHTTHVQANIISEHIRYNRTKLADVMPNDTIYVTQLRHPLTQLVSWLNYHLQFNVTDPVDVYKNLRRKMKDDLWNSWRQLGIPVKVNSRGFQSHLHQLDKEFDLVTITEQFDLSLLLLRRKLCWDISDMIYIPLKKATYKLNKNIDPLHIRNKQALNRRYQTLNPKAYSLYNHFNKTFTNLVVKAGPDLKEELSFFQKLNSNVSKYCSIYIQQITHNVSYFFNVTNFSQVLDIPASKWGSADTVDPVECAMMLFHKATFKLIYLIKKHDHYLLKTVLKKEILTKWLPALDQPINPKYGIPLAVLTLADAYDILPDQT